MIGWGNPPFSPTAKAKREFIGWATTLTADMISEIDISSEVDLCHVADYSETDFLTAVDVAGTNENSWEYAGFGCAMFGQCVL